MNLKYLVFSLVFTLAAIPVFAQNSTSSPYSGFGIGELEMSSGGRNSAMGHTGIALRSGLFLNTTNPASLTAIDPQSFLFDIGVNYKITQLRNSSKSVNVTDGNLSWLQLGFPIAKKIFGGITLNPKSSVGYNIYSIKSIDGTTFTYPTVFEGTGGLSEAAAMLAFKLSKNISLGAKSGIVWGNVTQNMEQTIPINSIEYVIAQEDNVHYLGSYLNLGTQINIPLNSKSEFILGGTAGLTSRLNSKTSTTITKTYSSSTETFSNNVSTSNSMKLPLDLGAGISYLYDNKWVATFDFKRCDWADASLNINSNKLSVNNSFRGGIEYIPKSKTSTLHQTARYRMGYQYDTGYLKMYNNQIHEQAVTIGFALPIRKDRSYANFAVELGKRGTTKSNLVEEKFIKFNLSFNLWDRWFVKRTFD